MDINEQLLKACEKGDEKIVEQLLSVLPYADINHAGIYGFTALIWASQNGHLEVVKLLHSIGK